MVLYASGTTYSDNLRINIVIDDELMSQALKTAGLETKRCC